MEIDKLHTCCFFGHRRIDKTNELRKRLNNVIEDLIEKKKVHTFLFGSKSEFDDLCHEIVSEIKEKYPHIIRVYVRASCADIDNSYRKYLLNNYEATNYPEKMRGAGKAAYVERNREMISKSRFCVAYYDENYLPPRRKKNKRDLFDYQSKSGTGVAYAYAVQKKNEIINVFNAPV